MAEGFIEIHLEGLNLVDGLCDLSWLSPFSCHHCRTGAKNLGSERPWEDAQD